MIANTIRFQISKPSDTIRQRFNDLIANDTLFKRYLTQNLNEISAFEDNINDGRYLFLENADFKRTEAIKIIAGAIEKSEYDNPFIREYFFHKEFTTFRNEIWFVRPYLHLEFDVMNYLMDFPIFTSILEKVNYAEYEALDFLSDTRNLFHVQSEDYLKLYKMLVSENHRPFDTYKILYNMIKSCVNNRHFTLVADGS